MAQLSARSPLAVVEAAAAAVEGVVGAAVERGDNSAAVRPYFKQNSKFMCFKAASSTVTFVHFELKLREH